MTATSRRDFIQIVVEAVFCEILAACLNEVKGRTVLVNFILIVDCLSQTRLCLYYSSIITQWMNKNQKHKNRRKSNRNNPSPTCYPLQTPSLANQSKSSIKEFPSSWIHFGHLMNKMWSCLLVIDSKVRKRMLSVKWWRLVVWWTRWHWQMATNPRLCNSWSSTILEWMCEIRWNTFRVCLFHSIAVELQDYRNIRGWYSMISWNLIPIFSRPTWWQCTRYFFWDTDRW